MEMDPRWIILARESSVYLLLPDEKDMEAAKRVRSLVLKDVSPKSVLEEEDAAGEQQATIGQPEDSSVGVSAEVNQSSFQGSFGT